MTNAATDTSRVDGDDKERVSFVRRAFRWIANVFVFLALYVSGIECSFAEVTRGTYTHRGEPWPMLTNTNTLDQEKSKVVEAYLDMLEDDAKTRYDRLDSKLRTLLATNALAFGLIGGFSLSARPVFPVVAVPLIVSAILALHALSVHKFQTLSLRDEEIAAGSPELKERLVRDRICSVNANGAVIDFMVDCFRGAHRYFIIGLLVVPAAYVLGR